MMETTKIGWREKGRILIIPSNHKIRFEDGYVRQITGDDPLISWTPSEEGRDACPHCGRTDIHNCRTEDIRLKRVLDSLPPL